MSNYDKVIRATVDMPKDIADVLEIDGQQLEENCQSAKINKWAKFKPFRCREAEIYPVLDNTGFPVKQTAIGSHYKCLMEANCGLSISFTGMPDLDCIQKEISMMEVGNDDDIWTYLRPTGGTSQPFRLVDFCGYNHNALPFLWQANMETKKVAYRGSEDYGKEVTFIIEIYDSDNETIEGMIEADDLGGTIYSGSTLYYCCALCHPAISGTQADRRHIIAYSIADEPIESINGRSASFTIKRTTAYYIITGNVKSGTTDILNYQVYHMLVRYDNDHQPEFIPIPYSETYPPRTYMIIQPTKTSVQFDIVALAEFVSYGSAIAGLTFQDVNNDISVNAWNGVTVKLNLMNESSDDKTVNFGRVYCQTNCHSEAVACVSIYDESYHQLDKGISVPANSSIPVYMTFADVFDFDNNGYIKIDNADVEISFWGEDASEEPTINVWSAGNDGTIIYHTTAINS